MSKRIESSRYKTTKNVAESNKEELIIVKGTIVKKLPNARFEVELEHGHLLKEAFVSGKMRKNYIQIALGDTVDVAVSRYDRSKGRIVFRGTEGKARNPFSK